MNDVFEAITNIFRLGGWVMYPLMGLSVVSLTLCFERAAFWWRTHGSGRRAWLESLAHAIRSRDRARAETLIKRDRSVYGQFASSVLELLDEGGGAARFSDADATAIIEVHRGRLERFNATLSTIVTASPMLGILGTVTGIIVSFKLIGGTEALTDPSEVAGGIAEALFTTAFGMIVSLVTLFPYVGFRAHADRALSRFEVLAALCVEAGQGDPKTAPKPHVTSEPKGSPAVAAK